MKIKTNAKLWWSLWSTQFSNPRQEECSWSTAKGCNSARPTSQI